MNGLRHHHKGGECTHHRASLTMILLCVLLTKTVCWWKKSRNIMLLSELTKRVFCEHTYRIRLCQPLHSIHLFDVRCCYAIPPYDSIKTFYCVSFTRTQYPPPPTAYKLYHFLLTLTRIYSICQLREQKAKSLKAAEYRRYFYK